MEQAKDNLAIISPVKADVLVVHHEDMHYTDNFTDTSPRAHNEAVQQPSDVDLQLEIERLTVTAFTKSASHNVLDETIAAQNSKNVRSSHSKMKPKRRKNKYVSTTHGMIFGFILDLLKINYSKDLELQIIRQDLD